MFSSGKSCESLVEKSPSPLLFKEPEGLIVVDLNDASFTNFNNDKKKIPEAAQRNKATFLMYLIIIILLGFISLLIVIIILKRRETIYSSNEFKEDDFGAVYLTRNDSANIQIKSNKLFDERNTSMYRFSILDDDCEIFYNSETFDLAELYTICDILDILLELETNCGARKKREVDEAFGRNFAPIAPTYENHFLRPYLGSISNEETKLTHIYTTSNKMPSQNIIEYEDENYQNQLYFHSYEYEDNLFAASELNNYEKNQYNFDSQFKKPIEENNDFENLKMISNSGQKNISPVVILPNSSINSIIRKKNDIHDDSIIKLSSDKRNNNESSFGEMISEVNTFSYYKSNTDRFIDITTPRAVKENKKKSENVSTEIATKNYSEDVITKKNIFLNFSENMDVMRGSVFSLQNSTRMPETSTNITLFTESDLDGSLYNNLVSSNNLIRHESSFPGDKILSKLPAAKNLSDNIKTSTPKRDEIVVKGIGRTNVENDFRLKSKTDAFLIANDDVQTNQPFWVNPCSYLYPIQYAPPYIPPYRLATALDRNHGLKVVPMNTQKTEQYILNPSMYPYMQSPLIQLPQYSSNYIPLMEYQQTHHEQYGYNGQIQVSGAGGQYYMCNPISTPNNNIVSFPGIEIRREDSHLQDLIGTLPKDLGQSNNTREALITCPIGQKSCADGSRCIINRHFCDNEIHCNDGSDERFCSCRDRVGKIRSCDGYFDCPNGEDEQGCFGCAKNEFSCDDWSKFHRSTCIPLEQRCDNIKQCEITGRDEEDCSVLIDRVGNQLQFTVSYSVGFLHRNYKGRWYPTCFGSESWAMEVCEIEAGPSIINPKTYMTSISKKYKGKFIDILPNNGVSIGETCIQDQMTFVQCPPIYCGMRMTIKNPYRPFEVETSAEELLNELERLSHGHEILNKTSNYSINNFSERTYVESNIRVVGGKPSQPAAWPWLISIYKNGIFHCGGVLINELWAITAAHCVDRFWQYYFEIQAGMLRRFSYSPMEQYRWATIIIPHENYDRSSLRNDIALIKLSSPARYNRYIRPICLPTEATAGRDYLQGPPIGAICTTVGWGATIEHGSDPDHMREVEIPILEHCNHPADRHGDVICAGLSEGGKDACQGDSGGPFMCRNPNNPSQWYLAGVVSHGEGCARPHEPGVYTRVSKYIAWITENIKQETFISRIPLQKCPGFTCKGHNKCLPKRRRCDKIVDCYLGDDEMNCENNIHDIFKDIMRTQYSDLRRDAGDRENNINLTYIFDTTTHKLFTSNNSLAGTAISLLNKEGDLRNSTMEMDEMYSPSLSNSKNNQTFEDYYFKCKRLFQILQSKKRCNKIVDCEDGTDEQNCLCSDYINNYNPSAICDGITDCADLSDEMDCGKCESSEYYCRQSQVCIDLSKRCDGTPDCLKKEDEWDCAALTNGVTLTLDSDLRPKLSMSGIITINRFGVWRPLCANMSDNEASIATNVCNLLGFEEYIEYHKFQVKDKPLNFTIDGFKQPDNINEPSDMCSGLYVRCSNVSIDRSLHNVYQDNVTSDVELYTLPWNAVIYSDGIYKCMGTILNELWILSSTNCFEGIEKLKTNYVVALLGKGKAQLEIEGPHEQVIRITESINIEGSDLILLRLEENISFSRYITPANLYTRRGDRQIENCITTGLEKNKSKYIFLNAVKNCPIGLRCFESKANVNCQNSIPWTGIIVCNLGASWYPAAVYHEKTGDCGLSSVKQYTSITTFRSKIINAMKQAPLEGDFSFCDGFRCKLGECIRRNKICNGVPDCRNSEDEEPSLCTEKEMLCHLTDDCECPISHLKCKNNRCIPKSSFCDKVNDCGDYEDEPDICSCKEYLNISDPSKICDGIVHCMDRTDEDPKLCRSKLHNIKCGNTSYHISNDVICDGFQDCPNGEDEIDCMRLGTINDKRTTSGEVMIRTGGIWHPGCFKMNYTATELEAICNNLGFTGRSISHSIAPRNITSLSVPRPVIDKFSIIWIHRNSRNKLKLKIRTGNEPYVKFIPDNQCYRLFLNCT